MSRAPRGVETPFLTSSSWRNFIIQTIHICAMAPEKKWASAATALHPLKKSRTPNTPKRKKLSSGSASGLSTYGEGRFFARNAKRWFLGQAAKMAPQRGAGLPGGKPRLELQRALFT